MRLKTLSIILFLLFGLHFILEQQTITLTQNSQTQDFQLVAEAAKQRDDLDFIHDRERAKICRPVYFMMQNPGRMDDAYDWQKARIQLRCDSAAEDAGFPSEGTQYFV